MNEKKELLGRDELNLIEVPFTLLTKESKKKDKILKFIDKQDKIIRQWEIIGSDKYGLPHALDEVVYIGLLALTKRDEFKNRKIYFNQYEFLKMMKWPINGNYYNRLYLALSRLTGMTIYTDYFWDNGVFKNYKKSGFHIINEFLVDKGKKNDKSSYFIWGETIFESLCLGNVKVLDIETYFGLETPTSKRFYRIWDKRAYKKNQITFDLFELCHEKLGISRTIQTSALLKQALKPALKEQKEKKLLSLAEYRKKKNKRWVLTIKKYDKEFTKPIENNKLKENPLLSKLLTLKIPQNRAEKLIKNYNDNNIIEDWICVLSEIRVTNPGGFLVTALKEKWELPESIRKKQVEKDKKKNEELKSQYYQSIFKQVDEWIENNMEKEQWEEEVERHREVFLIKYPFYRQFEGSIFLPYVKDDYKKIIAERLKLPSFEEWRERRI